MADRNADLIRAVRSGDLASAQAINASLLPLVDAVMRGSQGAVLAKAALAELGVIRHATVRLPLLEASADDRQRLREALSLLDARVGA